jgi:hypothetical protein
MPSRTIILAAVSGLAVTTAWAQAPSTAPMKSEPATPPAATQTLPAPSKPMTAPTAAPMNAPMKADFVNRQGPNQWVMSKFKGTNVVGPNNEKIGDVSDILFEKNGSVAAFVIGVGGFLGIGAKDVALTPASFQVIKDDDGKTDKLRLAMTKDELKQAPTFEYYSPPSTGAATNTQRPRTAPATQ